ncbi:ribosomal protein S18-alanine N-acetyltransferase [Heliophilum fasciatum]|uniref:[SSU ribosomal protein S18P]-alanine acetyltransferase n=1 Tax=Heliophilum fasciatum TaxID=35700 RepID=A0A4R2RZ50_9FIRM|nr:ribosomal protein S18-alanine N-acetyltransferase [Heliophilum fasciatum]MCW2276706.1 ribosomal-protein-alanine N-acetyltransferase [Heliophilum fasciatum]TCP68913.1 [SSU ribosomal protein S18P]-alanine acetyltransferase [Heliophilum fasciatum]
MSEALERFYFRPMEISDIEAVLAIEEQSFPTPWSYDAFLGELTESRLAHYWVCMERAGDDQQGDDERIVGYVGIWVIIDEAHITTIAVDPAMRGHGLGALVLQYAMAETLKHGGERMTLEVRPSNVSAQRLYEKLGFVAVGRRRGYYSDTGEDAIIMWCELTSKTSDKSGPD